MTTTGYLARDLDQCKTWDATMKPLAASPLWPYLRASAADSLVRSFGPDSGFGISSSDLNHTIFAAANAVRRADGTVRPIDVYNYLEGC